MQLLEERIRRDGKVAPGNVLRVDSFINHQIDVALLTELAGEFHRLFAGETVDKVLTVEASGIAIGCRWCSPRSPAPATCRRMCIPAPCAHIPTAM